MSFTTWCEEFAPLGANQRDQEALATKDSILYSIKKWEGARPSALAKHGVKYESHCITTDSYRFTFGAHNCPLCAKFNRHTEHKDCRGCPLEALGKCCISNYRSPYWLSTDNPEPMIEALNEALRIAEQSIPDSDSTERETALND